MTRDSSKMRVQKKHITDRDRNEQTAKYLMHTDRYDVIKEPSALISSILHMKKRNVKEFCIFLEGWPQAFVATDHLDHLLLLCANEEKHVMELVMNVDRVCSVSYLVFIKETRQLVVGGTGLLRKYDVCQGTEGSAKIEKGITIKSSLRGTEFIRLLSIDSVIHKMFVLTADRAIVFDYFTMEELKSIKDRESVAFTCCCMYRNTDYELFITGSWTGLIKIWNPELFSEIQCYKGHVSAVKDMQVCNQMSRLFSASDDGWVYIWALDIFQPPLQKLKIADTILRLGLTNEKGKLGYWCDVKDMIVFYEFDMFYSDYALMDSTVYKLLRVPGYDYHPDRIMVATEDGGMRHLNPVTAALIAYMFPMTSLRLVQHFAYNSFRRRSYMIIEGGKVVVLNCSQSPFRGFGVYKPVNQEDGVTCLCSSLVSIGNIDDVVVFAGLRNGQIQILGADCFVMTRTVQGHHSEVVMIDVVKEADSNSEYVYQSARAIISVGADRVIKTWILECTIDQDLGLDLQFRNVHLIRCDMCPVFAKATFDRICVVYDPKPKVGMYMVDLEQAVSHPKKQSTAKALNHTPDYDHTDKVTALVCCPLLRIFASSSRDRTIKIWDEDNQLVRELIFLKPVNSICFATDIGHLLAAFGPTIRCCEPDRYLPWSYLKIMKSKTYQIKWERELGLKVAIHQTAWIDPKRMRSTAIMKPGRQKKRRKGLTRSSLHYEDWELTFRSGFSKVPTTINVPLHTLTRHRRFRKRIKAGAQKSKKKVIGVVLSCQVQESEYSGSHTDVASMRFFSGEIDEDSRTKDRMVFSLTRKKDKEEEMLKVQTHSGESSSKHKVTFSGSIESSESESSTSEDESEVPMEEEYSDTFLNIFEAGKAEVLDKKYDILRHREFLSEEYDDVEEEEGDKDGGGEEEDDENEAAEDDDGAEKAAMKKEQLDEDLAIKIKMLWVKQGVLSPPEMTRPLNETARKLFDDLDENIEKVNQSSVGRNEKTFMTQIGRDIQIGIVAKGFDDNFDDLSDRVVHKALREVVPTVSLCSAPPSSYTRGSSPSPTAQTDLLKQESSLTTDQLKQKTEESSVPSPWELKKELKLPQKKIPPMEQEGTFLEKPSYISRLQTLLDGPTWAMNVIMKDLRRKAWFPKQTASDMKAGFEALFDILDASTNPDVLLDVVKFIMEVLQMADLPTELRNALEEAMQFFMMTAPIDLRVTCLPLIANFRRDYLEKIVIDMYQKAKKTKRFKILRLAVKIGINCLSKSETKKRKEIALLIREQPWFPQGVPQECDAVNILLSLLDPSTDVNTLLAIIKFIKDNIMAGNIPEELQEQIEQAILFLLDNAPKELCQVLIPELENVIKQHDIEKFRYIIEGGSELKPPDDKLSHSSSAKSLRDIYRIIRQQPWFIEMTKGRTGGTRSEWLALLDPGTDIELSDLQMVLAFTRDMMLRPDMPEDLRDALENAILHLMTKAPLKNRQTLFPLIGNIMKKCHLDVIKTKITVDRKELTPQETSVQWTAAEDKAQAPPSSSPQQTSVQKKEAGDKAETVTLQDFMKPTSTEKELKSSAPETFKIIEMSDKAPLPPIGEIRDGQRTKDLILKAARIERRRCFAANRMNSLLCAVMSRQQLPATIEHHHTATAKAERPTKAISVVEAHYSQHASSASQSMWLSRTSTTDLESKFRISSMDTSGKSSSRPHSPDPVERELRSPSTIICPDSSDQLAVGHVMNVSDQAHKTSSFVRIKVAPKISRTDYGRTTSTTTLGPRTDDGRTISLISVSPRIHDGRTIPPTTVSPRTHDGRTIPSTTVSPRTHDGRTIPSITVSPRTHDGRKISWIAEHLRVSHLPTRIDTKKQREIVKSESDKKTKIRKEPPGLSGPGLRKMLKRKKRSSPFQDNVASVSSKGTATLPRGVQAVQVEMFPMASSHAIPCRRDTFPRGHCQWDLAEDQSHVGASLYRKPREQRKQQEHDRTNEMKMSRLKFLRDKYGGAGKPLRPPPPGSMAADSRNLKKIQFDSSSSRRTDQPIEPQAPKKPSHMVVLKPAVLPQAPFRLWEMKAVQGSGLQQQRPTAIVGGHHKSGLESDNQHLGRNLPLTPTSSAQNVGTEFSTKTSTDGQRGEDLDLETLLWMLQHDLITEKDVDRISALLTPIPKFEHQAAKAADQEPQKAVQALAAVRELLSKCLWTPAEPGLRVAHTTTVSYPGAPPAGHSAESITALDGRAGMMTNARNSGSSSYGRLHLKWTTQVPSQPVDGLLNRALEVEGQSACSEDARRSVKPGHLHCQAVDADMVRNPQQPVSLFPASTTRRKTQVNLHSSSAEPRRSSVIELEGAVPTMLRYSSLGWLPEPLHQCISRRLSFDKSQT